MPLLPRRLNLLPLLHLQGAHAHRKLLPAEPPSTCWRWRPGTALRCPVFAWSPICVTAPRTHRVQTWRKKKEWKKQFGELKRDIGAIRKVVPPSFINPQLSPPWNKPCSDRRCISRYCIQEGIWYCQNLNHVVESQLLLWNSYHQWLLDIELIRIYGLFQLFILALTSV